MPTGYTARICEGEQSMSEFILGCARAFGACAGQRDNPMDDLPKIPAEIEFQGGARIAEAEKKLADLLALTQEEKIAMGVKEHKEQIKYYTKALKERKIVRARLDKMYARIEDWVPPSKDHDELKKFMLDQLQSTIENDGDVGYYERTLQAEKEKDMLDFYDSELVRAKWCVKHAKEEAHKEKDRYVNRVQWIKQLYNSLEDDPELTHLLLKKGIKI